MNREFEQVQNAARHPTKEILAVAACEDTRTAAQGCAWLERVRREVGSDCRLRYSWWTFSLLSRPSLRRLAAAEAAGADLVVIAAREGPGLAEPIKDWIRLWLDPNLPRLRCRAMVAFLLPSENDTGPASGVLVELKEFAERASLHFFAKGDEVHPDLIGEVCRPPAVGRVLHPSCSAGTAGARAAAPVQAGADLIEYLGLGYRGSAIY